MKAIGEEVDVLDSIRYEGGFVVWRVEPESVEKLRQILGGNGRAERAGDAYVLGCCDREHIDQAATLLTGLSKDRDAGVRAAVAWSLGFCAVIH